MKATLEIVKQRDLHQKMGDKFQGWLSQQLLKINEDMESTRQHSLTLISITRIAYCIVVCLLVEKNDKAIRGEVVRDNFRWSDVYQQLPAAKAMFERNRRSPQV